VEEPIVEIETRIDAAPGTVWQAMTSKTSPMFMGATMETDWMPGSRYRLHGEWGGKPFEDFGEVETADAPKELGLTHWAKTRERPASYNFLRFKIAPEGEGSKVTLAQFARGEAKAYDDKAKAEFKKNYEIMLDGLKQAAEGRPAEKV
jgi:uncharacterized protein YndB with AHSA1/START domain